MTIDRITFYRNIDKIMANAQALKKQDSITFLELVDDSFLKRNSTYPSMKSLFTSLGQSDVSQHAFENILESQWQSFISEQTGFESWDDFIFAAKQDYARKHILSGVAS